MTHYSVEELHGLISDPDPPTSPIPQLTFSPSPRRATRAAAFAEKRAPNPKPLMKWN